MKTHLLRPLRRFRRATKAVSALEYAILVGVIAVAVGAALATFGGEITTAIEKIGTNLKATTATHGSPPAAPSP